MLTTLRQAFDLVGRERPLRWILLVVLAVIVSGLEMVGALLVFTLLALVADPSGAIELPLVGDLRRYFADVEQTTLLLWIVAIMAVFFLIRGVARVGAAYIQSRIAHNAGARLSKRLVEGYLRWPYEQHLSRPSAELIRNGHQAVIDLVGGVLLPAIRIAAETVLVVGLLVMLFFIAPGASALALLVVGGAAVVLLVVIQPRIRRLGEVVHREAQTTLQSLQQSLHGVRDVKVLGRERFFANVYSQSRLRMARANYLRTTALQLPSIVIETALIGFILLFFSVTMLGGGAAQDTLSVLGLFAYVGLRLQPSLQQIIGGLNSLKFAAAPLQDIHADLLSMETSTSPLGEVDPLPLGDHLTLRGVGFRYAGADRDALQGVDLVIHPGEQIGICGPTGGGKTTLVDVIAGLLAPTDGQVLVDGHDLREHARAWQLNLGVVSQMVFLTDDTLRHNIALGVPEGEIDDDAITQAVELAQLEEFVAELHDGLDTTVGERGIRVSGGQRQRIAIARALYRRPSVLIFDEGTSALDNSTEALLMEAIERLRGRHTIILVAHRLSTVRNCDRVLFLEQGRISGTGTYDELCASNVAFRAMTGPR